MISLSVQQCISALLPAKAGRQDSRARVCVNTAHPSRLQCQGKAVALCFLLTPVFQKVSHLLRKMSWQPSIRSRSPPDLVKRSVLGLKFASVKRDLCRPADRIMDSQSGRVAHPSHTPTRLESRSQENSIEEGPHHPSANVLGLPSGSQLRTSGSWLPCALPPLCHAVAILCVEGGGVMGFNFAAYYSPSKAEAAPIISSLVTQEDGSYLSKVAL